MLKYIYLFSKGGTKMESTLALVERIDYLLSKSDLKGVVELLCSLSAKEKTAFASFCRQHGLKYDSYLQAIELIPDQSYKGLVDSIYRFRNSNIYSMRIVEARIDLLGQLLYYRLIEEGKSEAEALNLPSIQELRMRLDLMSKKSFWISSENISRCWDIVENINNPDSAILLGRSIKSRLATTTLNFVAKDKKHRMRLLKPSHVLIEHVTSHSHFFSKRRRILKRWQKAIKK